MARIDFPSSGDTHVDLNGQTWKKINNSWVKQFDYSIESPGDQAGVEFCKKDQVWSPIVYPVDSDVPAADGVYYARRNKAWAEVEVNMGPTFDGAPGLLYGVRDGSWELIPGDDLTVNYYDKTISDGRFAAVTHSHTLSQITDVGALAYEADAGAADDNIQYVRKNHDWEPVEIPVIPKHSNSVTIIDPQSTDDAIMFWTPIEITLDQVQATTLPAGSFIAINIFHSPSADGSVGGINQCLNSDVTINSSTGTAITVDNPIIPANSWVWVGIMGDPLDSTMFHLTAAY